MAKQERIVDDLVCRGHQPAAEMARTLLATLRAALEKSRDDLEQLTRRERVGPFPYFVAELSTEKLPVDG